MKKTVLIMVFVFSLCLTTARADFSDMEMKSDEMINAVNLLTEKNYVSGKSASEFYPDSEITRAEFAAVVLRMLDYMGENRPYFLKDVPKSVWYYYVAGSAFETGIMSGFEDGTFRGDDIIPKVQAVAIASRMLKDKLGTNAHDYAVEYTDAVPEWAKEYVQIVAQENIIEKNGAFNAESGMTRGEAAVMLARVYNKIKDTLSQTGYTGNYETRKPPVTIVIDPGHGVDSGSMSNEERYNNGWVRNESKGQWGEWRHWKSHTLWQDCGGFGCIGRGNCWYRMENGDREIEPEIDLKNAQSAVKYLEDMGYEARITRGGGDNPSMTNRLMFCYPNKDINAVPDADLFVCLHSNAGGGRGSAYIELAGVYDQAGIPENYAYIGNSLGKYINDEITSTTSMPQHGDGVISGMPELILFCKSPVPIAYLEIGFFDNANDLSILNSEYDAIGKAVATGIDKYCKDTMK